MAGERGSVLASFFTVAALAALLIASGALSGPPSASRSSTQLPVRASAASGQYFDYIVTILMENHNLCDVYYGNSSLSPCGTTPTGGVYETGLADNYSIPLNYNYCGVNPSLPNYLCLTGGSAFGCAGLDVNPNTGCATAAWNAPNIVDRLENGGLTWKAYMEDMPSNCDNSNSGYYAVRHDPFVYYNDIWGNPSRCLRVVPAGPSPGSDTTFLSDLNSTSTASNYMWLTPNTRNDAHDTNVTFGDAYLATLVPKILNSPVFQTQRAALFITYDEGYSHPTFAVWAGPIVKHWDSSTASYGHFSLLSTIEANWNLPYLNATNDGSAQDMSEFFTTATPDFSIAANPTTIFFLPGQTGTSNITVRGRSGFAGSVALSASANASGITTSCVPSKILPGAVSECTFGGSALGPYKVNVTGTNGTLAHTVFINVTITTAPPPVTTMKLQGTSGANGWYVTPVNVTLNATNLGAGKIYYSLDSGPWQVYSSRFSVGTGSHKLLYNATSGAGVQEQVNNATVKVDTAPPFVAASVLGTVGAHGWYTSGARVTLIGTDNTSGVASVTYRVDAGLVQTYSAPFDVTDGIHVLIYSARDAAGWASLNGSLTLKVDTTPPVFGSLSPTGVVTQSSVTVSWNATSLAGIVDYQVRVDNETYRNVGLNTSIQLTLPDGAHTVQVIATDTAGLNNASVIQFRVNTALGGSLAASTWLLLLPLFAAAAVLAAFAVTLVVLRRRRQDKVGRRR